MVALWLVVLTASLLAAAPPVVSISYCCAPPVFT